MKCEQQEGFEPSQQPTPVYKAKSRVGRRGVQAPLGLQSVPSDPRSLATPVAAIADWAAENGNFWPSRCLCQGQGRGGLLVVSGPEDEGKQGLRCISSP